MRTRAIIASLWFGILPSRFYEKTPHYVISYWAHLWINLKYTARWLAFAENDEYRDFERAFNPAPLRLLRRGNHGRGRNR